MPNEVDIIEDDILKKYPKVLDTLLFDHTTKQNIFWATDNYEHLGENYTFASQIKAELITGVNSKVIMPRVLKNKELQKSRVKKMAEVYTPSWICNDQLNGIDHLWFKRENVFNERVVTDKIKVSWITNPNKIVFPEGKTWKDYIKRTQLEITCGEAPYIVSRYDTTTGVYIPIKDRIGMLDRKLRIVDEHTKTKKSWLEYAQKSYKSIYGYEFQGDSLLLARESLLITFIEYYAQKFGEEPELSEIQKIAYIISWNIWQMDGLKMVIPKSCTSTTVEEKKNLFDEPTKKIIKCQGCETKNKHQHNGIYCLVMNWNASKEPKPLRFVDLYPKKEN